MEAEEMLGVGGWNSFHVMLTNPSPHLAEHPIQPSNQISSALAFSRGFPKSIHFFF
jgi:hypothetical protein